MIEQTETVADAAGGDCSGAARWRVELDGYLADGQRQVRIIGRHDRLSPQWLLKRELLARGARLVVAANNVSFVASGASRRVLVRNALHFLRGSEAHLLAGMPRAFRAQIPVIRLALTRADLVIAPCSAMAERVVDRVPQVRDRVTVRPHPVTSVGPRVAVSRPFILVPVVPGPYKNLVGELRVLLSALDHIRSPLQVYVTARPSQLPADVAANPSLRTLGMLSHQSLADYWRTAVAAFYPSLVESFGYPLAEAATYGLPVIAPDTRQAAEVAGEALRPYSPGSPRSLADALSLIDKPVTASPERYDRTSYFDWLFDERG